MRFTGYSFGSIRVDGVTYDHDLIIDRGMIRKRNKAASRKFRGAYGHTPLSAAEDIPWRCRRLVVGTGADGALPALQQVRDWTRPAAARSTWSSCPRRRRSARWPRPRRTPTPSCT
jgi:hypothetical protein